MFRIGVFSRLTQVSIKALRHYDALGLLRPSRVDPSTAYRYYSADQLPRLHRILALKDLGFSLEEVGAMLAESVGPAELRAMLQVRRSDAERRLREERGRLASIEARLRLIEQEDEMPNHEVVTKSLPAQTIVSLRRVIPSYWHTGELFGEMCGQAGAAGVAFAGIPVAICHDEGYKESDVDLEVGMPVAGRPEVPDPLVVRELEAVELAACTVHQGPYDGLMGAYEALMKWVEANAYEVCAPSRELYLRYEDGADPSTYVTEIQLPISPRAGG